MQWDSKEGIPNTVQRFLNQEVGLAGSVKLKCTLRLCLSPELV